MQNIEHIGKKGLPCGDPFLLSAIVIMCIPQIVL